VSPDTKQYLASVSFLSDDKPARGKLLDELKARVPVVATVDEVEAKAATVIGLRADILGTSGDEDIDRELNYLVGDLLSTAPAGRLQKALENGYVLCSTRVTRILEEGGEPVSKSARFMSDNPDVIERYSWEPAVSRAVKATERATATVEMTTRRVPLLASRRPVLARKAQEQLALAMPLDES
jgi:hypothetical protein